MKPPARTNQEAQAQLALDVLHARAISLRAELAGLRAELAEVEREFRSMRSRGRRRGSEQLVVAALRSDAIADAARSTLEEVARHHGGETSGRLSAAARLRVLREANEKLVVAALRSQEMEEEATAGHQRHVAFLATVAHELRNPLLPLRLAARLLTNAQDDHQLLLQLQNTITGQVAHISKLIGDLLDGARVSTGKFRLDPIHLDLVRILALAAETCAPLMEARHHRFEFSPPAEPLPVHGDPVRLAQIFANLLENASKYTPEGGHIVMQAGRQGDHAEVSIVDNGVGISPAALPHLFEMFVQDAPAMATEGGGLGIGLAVVQELVAAHGGTVSAHSEGRGHGSRFVVTLPLEREG